MNWPLSIIREVEGRKNMRSWKKWLLIGVVVVLLFSGALVALGVYADWAAEKNARAFCDEISIGSDISTATARAADRKIMFGPSSAIERKALWGASDSGVYTFYFFAAFIFDKAVCEVSVNREGKVRSKFSEMEYD
jgi:hypothetical protein